MITDLFEAMPGQPLLVPAGTLVYSVKTGSEQALKRAQRVVPHFVDRYNDGRVKITWAGSGGYWRRVTVRRSPPLAEVA